MQAVDCFFTTLAVLFPLLRLLISLASTVVIDPCIRRERRRTMPVTAALCLTRTAQND